MWNLEKDPHLSAAFANVTIFDRSPTTPACGSACSRPAVVFPRLRQRVAPVLGRLAPPEWVDDADFDIDFHLRRVALRHRAPSGSSSTSRRSWRRRPSTAPGRSGSSRSSTASRAAAPPCSRRCTTRSPTARAACACRCSSSTSSAIPSPAPPPRPPKAARAGRPGANPSRCSPPRALAHNLRRQAGMARRAAFGVAGTMTSPQRLIRLPADAVDVGRSLSRQVARDGRTSLAPLAGPLAHPALRRAAGAARRRQAGGQGARRQRQRPVRGRRGRRRRRLPPRPGHRRRRAAHLHAGEHPLGPVRRRQRVHPHPGAGARTGPTRRSASQRSAPGCRSRRRSGPSGSPSCSPGW